MPETLTRYRVFIGSPGGLDDERKRFRQILDKHTAFHSEPRGASFYPVGWEDTLGGVGRPQELINEDLRRCDYAVFILHDRWGSPTGSGYSSGTEEEWELAEKLYTGTTVRNIALFFKQVDPRQLRDPGDQLKKVLAFKKRIEAGKKYLFKNYSSIDEFCEELEKHLAKWLRDHEVATKGGATGVSPLAISSAPKADVTSVVTSPAAGPGFDYWISEAKRLSEAERVEDRNYAGALFCAE